MNFVVTRQKSLDFPLSSPPSQVKVPLLYLMAGAIAW